MVRVRLKQVFSSFTAEYEVEVDDRTRNTEGQAAVALKTISELERRRSHDEDESR